MSLYGSLEGFREVLSVVLGVLLEHSTGLKVKELREVLKRAHRIDLEELRKDLGFGNIISFLAELPGCRLIHPERHGDCVVQYAPETGSQEEPDGVYPGRNLPIPTSTPDNACSSLEAPQRRTAVTATPESHHQRRPPGLDEEILCVLTQPMFACGLRVQKLTEILSVERGIDLDDLSWGLGHQDTVDFLQHVPNVEVLDPTKGEDCVVKYQPGFRRKDGRLIPCGLPLTLIATLDHKLRTEFEDSQASGVSHSFLYPVPSNSSQRQIPSRGNSTSKHFTKPGSGHPSMNNRNAPGTVYMSKHPQKPGLPQKPRTPGMAMVFRASKTTNYVVPQQRKTPATQNVNRAPSQKSKSPLETYPTPAYATSISPGQQMYQALKHMPTGPSQGYAPATTTRYASSQAINSDKDLDPVLMDEILVVLLQQPRGVGFGEFAGLFHRTHGYQFKLCRHGFTTLRTLLDEMTDLVSVSEDPTDPLITCKGRHHYVFIGGGPFSSQI
ncbi:uncharacterized protein [Ambystoma mexicanum]|uniref:uncharacterized protein isoform X2 n=1 Tax=Ambystoma mexicanum TaxID=8296 RepID=UPI0037E84B5E